MRMLLRDKETHLFFQGPDRWTADPARAFDFRFLERALHYCQTWRLTGVEVAFVYDRPEQVIVVPLEGAARQVAMA